MSVSSSITVKDHSLLRQLWRLGAPKVRSLGLHLKARVIRELCPCMLTVGSGARVHYVVDSFPLARVGDLEMEHHDPEVFVSYELPAHSACGLWRTFRLKSE